VSRSAAEPLTPIRGPLALVVTLAAVAGFLDAISVARLTGAFVAFQSGNVVLIGLGVSGGPRQELDASAISVVAFIVGSALAATISRIGADNSSAVQQRLLACTTALLVVFAAIVLGGAGFGSQRPSGTLRFIGIVAAAVAMALQTPTVRRVGDVPVSSTFVTGVMSRLGQALGDLVHGDARALEMRFLRVLGLTTVAFLGGAIAGGVGIKELGNVTALVPAAALLTVTLVVRRRIDTG
jgi:uncharacterized membrane protein YoaK (UPF0700 family)